MAQRWKENSRTTCSYYNSAERVHEQEERKPVGRKEAPVVETESIKHELPSSSYEDVIFDTIPKANMALQ